MIKTNVREHVRNRPRSDEDILRSPRTTQRYDRIDHYRIGGLSPECKLEASTYGGGEP